MRKHELLEAHPLLRIQHVPPFSSTPKLVKETSPERSLFPNSGFPQKIKTCRNRNKWMGLAVWMGETRPGAARAPWTKLNSCRSVIRNGEQRSRRSRGREGEIMTKI